MTVIDELVRNNDRYAGSFRYGDLGAAPRRRVAVVTCMDARLLPSRFFGLAEGDAHIIRNAGGSAREALRSLVISQTLLGTQEVALVKHTDCGMLSATNRDIREQVRLHLDADASDIDFLPFSSLEEAVRDDVRFLTSSPLIAEEVAIRGFIYDVMSGRVRELE
jgi:carbonic anhydrase